MASLHIGILKETKTPPDRRVPLTPAQCARMLVENDELEITVESSDIRAFADAEYRDAGIVVSNDLSKCDVLFGVKEVAIDALIPNKTYFFFSHTIKMQPYNRDLLREILAKNISLVDYETLADENDVRIIGFGRYAGIVGAYNAFLAYGVKTGRYQLKPANKCANRSEMEADLKKLDLPSDFKVVITGHGRVGRGAVEIMNVANIKQVTPKEFLTQQFDEPVGAWLGVEWYNKRADGQPFDRIGFYKNPVGHESDFMKFAKIADVYVACHYWDSRAPFIYSRDDVKSPDWNIKVVADISCDIDGPVATTLRPSTIADPLYGYDPQSETETDFTNDNAVGVMAVDNLPCELPKDASEDFGKELMDKVLPHLLNDAEKVIERATITKNGSLTEYYDYLQPYVDGVEVT